MNVSSVNALQNDTYSTQASKNATQKQDASVRQDDAAAIAAQSAAAQSQAVQQQQSQNTLNANRVGNELQMQLTASQVTLSARTAQSVAQVGTSADTTRTANAAQAPTRSRADLESQAEVPAQQAQQAERADEQRAADTREAERNAQSEREAQRLDSNQSHAVNSYQTTQQLLQPPRYTPQTRTQA